MVIKTNSYVAKRSERLEQNTAFHECRVAKAAHDFQTEWLFPLTDPDIAEEWYFCLLDPDVGKCRATEESEVHLKEVVRRFCHTALRGKASAAKIRSVLNLALRFFAGSVLMNPARVRLENAVDRHARIGLCARLVLKCLHCLVEFGNPFVLKCILRGFSVVARL